MTQVPAALALAAALIAVPGVPVLAATLGPADDWRDATSEQPLAAVSGNGVEVVLEPLPGWQYRALGDTVVLRSGTGSSVQLRVFDREGRDPDAISRRVIRVDRIAGASTALLSGSVATPDGELRGRPCTIVVDGSSGACAFLFDEDVLVAVDSIGTADTPPPPLADVLTRVHRSER